MSTADLGPRLMLLAVGIMLGVGLHWLWFFRRGK